MKMNYQLKSNRNARGTRNSRNNILKWAGAVFAILVVLLLIFSRGTSASFFTWIISPLWGGGANSAGAASSSSSAIISLEQRLAALESSEAKISALTEENTGLKELLGRTTVKNTMLATVLKKPPYSAYDTLVLDVGTSEGVNLGDKVFALGNVPIGSISEVHAHTSKVTLYSSAGQKYDVFVGKKNIQTTATARGGGVFEIILPRDSGVVEGDMVTVPDVDAAVFGTVMSIVTQPARAFSVILFNSPVNIAELRWVEVETQ